MLVLFFIGALPGYLLDLPWHCQTGERFQSGDTDSELALCHPDDSAPDAVWVKRISDAFEHAGLRSLTQAAPLGPHIAAVTKTGMLSATFVGAPGGGFEVWLAEQIFQASSAPPPLLPAGATLVTDQSDAHSHLMSINLAAPYHEADALLHATLVALGADPSGAARPAKDGESGAIHWHGQSGFYQLRPAGARRCALVLFAGQAR